MTNDNSYDMTHTYKTDPSPRSQMVEILLKRRALYKSSGRSLAKELNQWQAWDW
jgi:hypothetical protein